MRCYQGLEQGENEEFLLSLYRVSVCWWLICMQWKSFRNRVVMVAQHCKYEENRWIGHLHLKWLFYVTYYPTILKKQIPSLQLNWGFGASWPWSLALHLISRLFLFSQAENSLGSNLNSHWHQRDSLCYTRIPQIGTFGLCPVSRTLGLPCSLSLTMGPPFSLPGILHCLFTPNNSKLVKAFIPHLPRE